MEQKQKEAVLAKLETEINGYDFYKKELYQLKDYQHQDYDFISAISKVNMQYGVVLGIASTALLLGLIDTVEFYIWTNKLIEIDEKYRKKG